MLCQAVFHLILNPRVFQGEFNPYVSDSFVLNSSEDCFVKVSLFSRALQSSYLVGIGWISNVPCLILNPSLQPLFYGGFILWVDGDRRWVIKALSELPWYSTDTKREPLALQVCCARLQPYPTRLLNHVRVCSVRVNVLFLHAAYFPGMV